MGERNNGWTLTELIVVIAIVVILVALLTSFTSHLIGSARSVTCSSNLRSLGVAHHLWRIENNNELAEPPNILAWRPTRHLYEGGYIEGPEAFLCPSAPTIEDGAWYDVLPTNTSTQIYQQVFRGKPVALGVNGFAMYQTYLSAGQTTTTFMQHFGSPENVPLFLDMRVFQLNRVTWPMPTRFDRIALRHGRGTTANVVFMDGHVRSLDRESLSELHPLGDESVYIYH